MKHDWLILIEVAYSNESHEYDATISAGRLAGPGNIMQVVGKGTGNTRSAAINAAWIQYLAWVND